ncbi:hypothetical protein [Actinoalloteichus caeruleus]|uniref:hypothetical protein n=1 Tax=Actinoalloteichus cyanogriseus TaxID=2893586 RepID=UPI003AAB82DC
MPSVIPRCLEQVRASFSLGLVPHYPQSLLAGEFQNRLILATLANPDVACEVGTARRLPKQPRGPLRCRPTAYDQAGRRFLLISPLLPEPVATGS